MFFWKKRALRARFPIFPLGRACGAPFLHFFPLGRACGAQFFHFFPCGAPTAPKFSLVYHHFFFGHPASQPAGQPRNFFGPADPGNCSTTGIPDLFFCPDKKKPFICLLLHIACGISQSQFLRSKIVKTAARVSRAKIPAVSHLPALMRD